MKNFTFKMFLFLLSVFIGVSTYAQEWNFSSATLSVLGSIAETKTVEGLTIYGASGATIDVDANNKSLDGMSFTHRLKFGGSGTFGEDGKPVSRVISFPVNGNTKITVMGMSSSSSADRNLIIAAGKKETEVGKFPALGASISKGEYTYTGVATTIYLFSPSSGVNLYYLKATALATGLNKQTVPEFKVFPNPASGYISIGVNEPGEIGIYNIAGSLLKQQMISSSQNIVNISYLHSGIYFVKMMNNKSMTQKLIIR